WSKLITHHHTEWQTTADAANWQAFRNRLSHDPEWLRHESERINNLVFWDEVAEKVGLPEDGRVSYFHPVEFVGALTAAKQCSCTNNITDAQLQLITPSTSKQKIEAYIDSINEMFIKFNFDKCISRAHILAQILHESGGLRFTTEGLPSGAPQPSYSPYIGRGLLQITWEENYRLYGLYAGENFLGNPNFTKMSELPHCVFSAGWFWSYYKKLTKFSDSDDFIFCTAKINGGFNGYDDRLNYLNKAIEVLDISNCTRLNKRKTYDLRDSEAFNNAKFSFAWGFWSDPLSRAHGKTKDKIQAIIGYTRFLELYNSNESVRGNSTTTYYGAGRKSPQAKLYAEARIISLETSL
ncbi:hypothetical protein QN386_25380, partial [Pseudomonas sp. CCI3.2]|nr:hypothetical protein [Pseudomonas sp. MH10out]MEB0094482.1 hypothetical protein [Pseudomonas sp. CCI4.2]MEB0104636.1 hypothetical protein [Pseudomonas sp. CCI3.2]MEB0133589.1 hypothetical protein [Pseudomonas sp. CCI2.4]MEB0160864.1 hypothetical protein [Pseudomonas sp. AH2 (2023)]MEB0170396.1 hypothetical protein [Pseudomonas sp. CCC4.4]